MSEPKRYSDLDVWKALHFGENDSGWVKYEDYARLKAEVERLQSIHSIDSIGIEQLKAEVERLTSDIQMEKENEDRLVREWQKANNEVYGLQRQVAALIDNQTRLKAEVERLTKFNEETSAYIAKEERKMGERYEMMQEDIDKLIKAGDDLAAHIGNDEASQDKCAVVWQSVKKGVQS